MIQIVDSKATNNTMKRMSKDTYVEKNLTQKNIYKLIYGYVTREKSVLSVLQDISKNQESIFTFLIVLLSFLFDFSLGILLALLLNWWHFEHAIFVDDDAPPEWYDFWHVHTINEGIKHARWLFVGTVRVFEGIYRENIVLEPITDSPFDSIWIIGNGSNSTVIDGGGEVAIWIKNSGWNRITGFTITNSSDGIRIDKNSQWNFIFKNTFTGNDVGINVTIEKELYNPVWYNNFINNTLNACDVGKHEWSFDNWEEKNVGNYWDDYRGVDSDGDGIGDTPYLIPCGNSKDSFPLMRPYQ